MLAKIDAKEFDRQMRAIPGVERTSYEPAPGMECVYEGRIGEKSDAEARYLACCKQELSLKIALKAIQETKKETEKELAELSLIGQVKFEW